MRVKIGLDLVGKYWPQRLRAARAGLVVHPASVNTHFTHARTFLSYLAPRHNLAFDSALRRDFAHTWQQQSQQHLAFRHALYTG